MCSSEVRTRQTSQSESPSISQPEWPAAVTINPAMDEVSRSSRLALGPRQSSMPRSWTLAMAAAAWLGVALFTALWADMSGSNWDYTGDLAAVCAALAGVLAAGTFVELRFARRGHIQSLGPWL